MATSELLDAALASTSSDSASASASASTASVQDASNALRLSWSFGFNKDLVGGVHNLSTDTRRAIFYPAAHTGVIYDYAQRSQKLLQGHCHPISACIVSEDKRWIVTADRGEESMLVVWDSLTGFPIKTIFQPHAYGVQAIDISPDALFIATLSAVDPKVTGAGTGATDGDEFKAFAQELSVWEWTSSNSSALYSSMVATEDLQHCVRFNTYDIREIVTNGKQRVIFWNWQSHKLLFYSPSLSQKDFRQVIGNFTQSLFVPDSKQALTATEDGDLVLWDAILTQEEEIALRARGTAVDSRIPDRKAVKIARLAGGGLPSTQNPADQIIDAEGQDQDGSNNGGSKKPKKKKTKAGGGPGHQYTPRSKSNSSLNYLIDMDGYLVLGSSDGSVRFYDFDFRLVAWFEDMNAGPVMSVSFAAINPNGANGSQPQAGNDQTDDVFRVPDFIVGTSSAFIIGMKANAFEEHESDKRRGTLLMQGVDEEILGLAAHPLHSQLAVCSDSGNVQLWDYSSKRLIMMKRFDAEKNFRPQTLCFSHDGKRLFVGFMNGLVKILHAQKLDELATFRFSKVPVTHIRISPDSTLFVAVDANLFVGMWRYKKIQETYASTMKKMEISDKHSASQADAHGGGGGGSHGTTAGGPEETANKWTETEDDWAYIGRCKSHAKPLTGIEFVITSNEKSVKRPMLVSVSEDKTLVEYCLSRSSIVDGVVLTGAPVKIEQSGTPTACCWHAEMKSLHEDLVIVANDEYKLKQWNANNKTCRKTTLGPTYGGPINRLLNLPVRKRSSTGDDNGKNGGKDPSEVYDRYCAYSTHEKVVGLMKIPFDGNPHKSMGLIAHPGVISNMDVSYDGNYLLTAGGKDMVVNLWEIHTSRLDAMEASGGHGLEPYLTLLEGGRDGDFYNEIVDYFYYSQIHVQGENATSARQITSKIPLREIPNVMRALGFYPTEEEIQNMWSEVQYSRFTESTQAVEEIDLGDFIKLYINHRPVFGITKDQIRKVFDQLGGHPTLEWRHLEKLLKTMGEKMSEEELQGCLDALLLDGTLDESYSSLTFADKILGFDDYEAANDQDPASESCTPEPMVMGSSQIASFHNS